MFCSERNGSFHVHYIIHISDVALAVQWTCIIFGALLAVFAIIWDALISYRKVKAIKVKFLWGILSIQGIGITLLLLVKISTTSIVLLLLAIQIISLVATLIIGRKTDKS